MDFTFFVGNCVANNDKSLQCEELKSGLLQGTPDTGNVLDGFNLQGPGITSTPNKSWPPANISGSR